MSRARPTRLGAQRVIGRATAGNERLTTVTGAPLIGLRAIIGVTLIALASLLSVHMFIGMPFGPRLHTHNLHHH